MCLPSFFLSDQFPAMLETMINISQKKKFPFSSLYKYNKYSFMNIQHMIYPLQSIGMDVALHAQR